MVLQAIYKSWFYVKTSHSSEKFVFVTTVHPYPFWDLDAVRAPFVGVGDVQVRNCARPYNFKLRCKVTERTGRSKFLPGWAAQHSTGTPRRIPLQMITSSNGNIPRHLAFCEGESTGVTGGFPSQKASDAELRHFLWYTPNKWLSKQSMQVIRDPMVTSLMGKCVTSKLTRGSCFSTHLRLFQFVFRFCRTGLLRGFFGTRFGLGLGLNGLLNLCFDLALGGLHHRFLLSGLDFCLLGLLLGCQVLLAQQESSVQWRP